MSLNRTLFQVRRPITRPLRDSQDGPWSRYLSLLGDAILDQSTVKSRYVQIGALSLTWLITVSAIGERQTSALLTLAMPRGRLLRVHRYQRDSLKSRSRLVKPLMVNLPPPPKRPWWHFLTRG
jgi:hypothetical protein